MNLLFKNHGVWSGFRRGYWDVRGRKWQEGGGGDKLRNGKLHGFRAS